MLGESESPPGRIQASKWMLQPLMIKKLKKVSWFTQTCNKRKWHKWWTKMMGFPTCTVHGCSSWDVHKHSASGTYPSTGLLLIKGRLPRIYPHHLGTVSNFLIWWFPDIGVTPKSSILVGCSLINHPKNWIHPFMETSILINYVDIRKLDLWYLMIDFGIISLLYQCTSWPTENVHCGRLARAAPPASPLGPPPGASPVLGNSENLSGSACPTLSFVSERKADYKSTLTETVVYIYIHTHMIYRCLPLTLVICTYNRIYTCIYIYIYLH